MPTPDRYDEQYRPQFHFTAPRNYIKDPNGLVYYDGEYHLCYQYWKYGRENEPESGHTWGHAVSDDLVHWKQLTETGIEGSSGTCVVDQGNASGFGQEKEDVMEHAS